MRSTFDATLGPTEPSLLTTEIAGMLRYRHASSRDPLGAQAIPTTPGVSLNAIVPGARGGKAPPELAAASAETATTTAHLTLVRMSGAE